MRISRAILAVGLALMPATAASVRTGVQAESDQEREFFSGTVADLDEGSITVERTTLGQSERRTFLLAQDTRVEGQLRVNARVTVRYRSTGEGDVAVHIIVRGVASSLRW